MEPTISVSVPARPEFVYLFRTVVASVAGRLDLPFEVIQDMRLAVHEASADLLAAGPTAETLTLRLIPEADRLTVLIWTDADVAEWPRAVGHDQLTWQILSQAPRQVSTSKRSSCSAGSRTTRLPASS